MSKYKIGQKLEVYGLPSLSLYRLRGKRSQKPLVSTLML